MVTVVRQVLSAATAKELIPLRLLLRVIAQGVSRPAAVAREVFSAIPLRNMALMSRACRLPVALMLLRQGVPLAHEGLARVLSLRIRWLLLAVQVLQVSHCLFWMDGMALRLLLARVAGHVGQAGAGGLLRQTLLRRLCAVHRGLALPRREALLPRPRRPGQLDWVDTHLYLSLLQIDHSG